MAVQNTQDLQVAIYKFAKLIDNIDGSAQPWSQGDHPKIVKLARAITDVLTHLDLDILLLTDPNIRSHLQNLFTSFEKILGEIIETPNNFDVPNTQLRLIEVLHGLNTVASKIPMMVGGLDSNLRQLTATANQHAIGAKHAEDTIREYVKRANEALQILQAQAIDQATAPFTDDFSKRADLLEKRAKKWILLAGATAAVAALSAFVFSIGVSLRVPNISWLVFPGPDHEANSVFKATSRIAFIGLMAGVAAWCGRNYRDLKNLAASYSHRAMSIGTIQAFRTGVDNEILKDQVTAEAAAAIFRPISFHGEEHSSKSEPRFVDVVRSPLTGAAGAAANKHGD